MNHYIAKIAYIFWKGKMFDAGYGTPEDIDWAVKWHILQPFEHPVITAGIRMWIIRKFGPSAREKDEK